MSKKIIISKETYDAQTETNPDNLIFSSDYNTLKHYISGTVQMSWSSTSWNGYSYHEEITHGLGYIPFFMVFVTGWDMPDGYNLCPFMYGDLSDWSFATAFADNEKLHFVCNDNITMTPYYPYTFKYRIFKNSLGL